MQERLTAQGIKSDDRDQFIPVRKSDIIDRFFLFANAADAPA
jgi:hypothetical protein